MKYGKGFQVKGKFLIHTCMVLWVHPIDWALLQVLHNYHPDTQFVYKLYNYHLDTQFVYELYAGEWFPTQHIFLQMKKMSLANFMHFLLKSSIFFPIAPPFRKLGHLQKRIATKHGNHKWGPQNFLISAKVLPLKSQLLIPVLPLFCWCQQNPKTWNGHLERKRRKQREEEENVGELHPSPSTIKTYDFSGVFNDPTPLFSLPSPNHLLMYFHLLHSSPCYHLFHSTPNFSHVFAISIHILPFCPFRYLSFDYVLFCVMGIS